MVRVSLTFLMLLLGCTGVLLALVLDNYFTINSLYLALMPAFIFTLLAVVGYATKQIQEDKHGR